MTPIAREDFTNSLFQLLKETFEGPPAETGSAYLDKGAGLFQTLDKMTAATASMSLQPGAPTIAAHCEHARFYVVALHAFMRGATGKIDWQQSWQVQVGDTGGVARPQRKFASSLYDSRRASSDGRALGR